MLTMQHLRRNTVKAMLDLRGGPPALSGGDLYEFGVYTGGGLRAWVEALNTYQSRLHLRHVWGFDSFQGMPDSIEPKGLHYNRAWRAGGLNAAEQLGIFDFPTLSKYIVDKVRFGRTTLVQGFFNESLPLVISNGQSKKMRPALILDIDCDIHASTIEAITFMHSQGLLVRGSVVYYDDWNSPDEVRAHQQMTKRFGLRWRQLLYNVFQLL